MGRDGAEVHPTSDAAGDGALAEVRSATAAVHRRSERRLLATDPFRSAGHYRELLAVLGGWELSVRAGLAATTGDPADRRRLGCRRRLLEQDLARLPPADRSEPILRAFRPGSGAAAVLGARYVVEGSRAGGRVLATLARRQLGAEVPIGFLTDADPTAWDEVTASLRAMPAAGAAPAVATARRAFTLVEHYLEG